jgi:hypothetical protein
MTQNQLTHIRLLSSRFLELQGLRVAMAGVTIAAVFGGYLASTHPTDTGGLVGFAVAFVLMLPGQWWAHRYYAQTVGRQVRQPRNLLPTVILFTTYFAVATFIDKRYPELPAGTPTAAFVVLMSLIVALRDWPWRAHYAGVAAAVSFAYGSNVVGVDVIDRGMTLAMTMFVAGLAMVPAGLLDHRLLMKLIEQVREPVATGRGESAQ